MTANIRQNDTGHPSPYPVERALDHRLTEKMSRRDSRQGDGPESLSEVHHRLERFLSGRLDEPFALRQLNRLAGGGANDSYRFRLVREKRTDDLVLRIKAPAGICVTEVEREFQILRATHGVIPVPEPFWMTTDPKHFGEPALSLFHPGPDVLAGKGCRSRD